GVAAATAAPARPLPTVPRRLHRPNASANAQRATRGAKAMQQPTAWLEAKSETAAPLAWQLATTWPVATWAAPIATPAPTRLHPPRAPKAFPKAPPQTRPSSASAVLMP